MNSTELNDQLNISMISNQNKPFHSHFNKDNQVKSRMTRSKSMITHSVVTEDSFID